MHTLDKNACWLILCNEYLNLLSKEKDESYKWGCLALMPWNIDLISNNKLHLSADACLHVSEEHCIVPIWQHWGRKNRFIILVFIVINLCRRRFRLKCPNYVCTMFSVASGPTWSWFACCHIITPSYSQMAKLKHETRWNVNFGVASLWPASLGSALSPVIVGSPESFWWMRWRHWSHEGGD